ncbi:MAG: hypothetical protein JWS11_3276, partial [Cypionkella sp.]|nr:hypothetical protein [Cypionkella sp.]
MTVVTTRPTIWTVLKWGLAILIGFTALFP